MRSNAVKTALNVSLALEIAFAPALVTALPDGGSVQAGSVSISTPSAGRMQVNQGSDRAIIDWRGFDIGAGESVSFAQPSASAVALNRVRGGGQTLIDGSLTANGKLFLVNPNGGIFGGGAEVNTASFLATTSDISNHFFMHGIYGFNQPGGPGAAIENYGDINVADTGFAALVAPSVKNAGAIRANLGTVTLASGNLFAVDFYGDGMISFAAHDVIETKGEGVSSLVNHSGSIVADGGVVSLSARALEGLIENVINMDGTVRARTAQLQNGKIVLDGGGRGIVQASGLLDTSGVGLGETGGIVKVLGERVALIGNATIDVSGNSGGGAALVGGSYQGSGAERTAREVYIGQNASIDASATDYGDGGLAVVWSDETTRFHGVIHARGGAAGGDGGLVETSGAQVLSVAGGRVDAGSIFGVAGDWLLDPADIFIGASGATGGVTDPSPGDNPFQYESNESTNGFVAVDDIELAMNNGTSVTIRTTDGSITVEPDAIINTIGTDSTLMLDASEDIFFDGEFRSSAVQNGGLQDWFVNDLHFKAGGDVFVTGSIYLGTVDEAGFFTIDAPNGGIEFSLSAFADAGGGLFTAAEEIQLLDNSRLITGTGGLVFFADSVDLQWGTISATTGTLDFNVSTLNLEDDLSSIFSAGIVDITADTVTNGGRISGQPNLFEAGRDPSLVRINANSIELKNGEIESTNGTIEINTGTLSGAGIIELRDFEGENLAPGLINIAATGAITLGATPDGESPTAAFIFSEAGPVGLEASELELIDGGISLFNGFLLNINATNFVNHDSIFVEGADIHISSLDSVGAILETGSVVNLGSIIAEDGEINIASGSIDSSGALESFAQLGTPLVIGEEPRLPTRLLNLTATGDITLRDIYHGDTLIARAGGAVTLDYDGILPLLSDGSQPMFEGKVLGIRASTLNMLPTFALGLDLDRIAVDLFGSNESFTYHDPNVIAIGGVSDILGANAMGDMTLTAVQAMALAGPVTSGANVNLNAPMITGEFGPGSGIVEVSGVLNTTLTGNVDANTVALGAGGTLTVDSDILAANNLGIRANVLDIPLLDGEGVLQTDVDVLALDLTGDAAVVEDAGSLEIGSVGSITGVTAVGSVSISAEQDIVVGEPITSEQVILSAGNSISGAGAVVMSRLGLRANSVNLTGGSNVDILAADISGQQFAFTDIDDLTVGAVGGISGVAAADFVQLTAGGDLILSAGITSAQAALTAGGSINGSASITAASLGLRASTVDLENTGDVDVLAADISGESFTYSDANDLIVGSVGDIVGVTAVGAVALGAGGSLQLDASVASEEVAMTAANMISGTGNVNANKLGLRANTVDLANSGDVDVLAADISGQSFVFSDSNDLAVGTVGDISGVNAASFVSLTASGDLSIDAGVSSGAVALNAGDSISGSGNVIAEMLGLRASTVDLAGSGDVDVLAADISGQSFTFNDTNDLTIGSVGDIAGITAVDTVALSAAGDLTLDEAISSDAVALSAGGQIGGDGSVTANRLGLRADTVSLPNSSDVDVLAAEIRSGDFSYQDGNGLTIGQVGDIVGLNVSDGSAELDVNGTLAVATNMMASNGDLRIVADSVSFAGGANSVAAAGMLRLLPQSADASIGVAGGEGGFQFDQRSVAALADGFSQISIGRDDGSHVISVNAVTISDPLLLQAPQAGGQINVNGQITAVDDASITLIGPGATTTLADNLVTSGESIFIDDSVVLLGNVLLDTTAGGSVSTGGDIVITGPVFGPGSLDAVAGTAGEIGLSVAGSEGSQLQSIALSGANVDAGTVFADDILIFDSARATGTLIAGSTLAFENVLAFNVTATVAGVSGPDLACNVPVDPLTGRQFINGAQVFAATGDLDNVLNYLSARGGTSWVRSDDEDTDTAAGEAFRTDQSRGGNVTNTFNKDYRLLAKEGQLEPVFEDNPYIEDGFWESELDIRR